jgi:hypothetical protein
MEFGELTLDQLLPLLRWEANRELSVDAFYGMLFEYLIVTELISQ